MSCCHTPESWEFPVRIPMAFPGLLHLPDRLPRPTHRRRPRPRQRPTYRHITRSGQRSARNGEVGHLRGFCDTQRSTRQLQCLRALQALNRQRAGGDSDSGCPGHVDADVVARTWQGVGIPVELSVPVTIAAAPVPVDRRSRNSLSIPCRQKHFPRQHEYYLLDFAQRRG